MPGQSNVYLLQGAHHGDVPLSTKPIGTTQDSECWNLGVATGQVVQQRRREGVFICVPRSSPHGRMATFSPQGPHSSYGMLLGGGSFASSTRPRTLIFAIALPSVRPRVHSDGPFLCVSFPKYIDSPIDVGVEVERRILQARSVCNTWIYRVRPPASKEAANCLQVSRRL